MRFIKKTHIKIIVAFVLSIPFILGISFSPHYSESEEFQYRIDPPDPSWVDQTLAGLTLREKIAQLIQIRVRGKFMNEESPEFKELLRSVQQHHVGGVVLFAGNIYESALLLNTLQSQSKLPLLVSADFERGASFRIDGTTSFPWTMAVGATGSEEFAYQQGIITAREARALGVHWIFAPVMDVNNNPSNPVINIRSFGENPQLVSRLGSAFIRGIRAGGALSTAKHFPGHGDTTTDSHIGLAVVPSDIDRLQSVELVPFKSAIAAGVDAIMTAHVAMPEITRDPEIPATLSSDILTDLLRNNLQFKGLIVTDAMEMGGITNKYWCGLAAVEAIEAGADIVLLPTNTLVAINEIERAVERGDVSPSRIDASVKKVLAAKSSLGLPRQRTVSIENLERRISSPGSQKLAQDIADHSITAIMDENHLLPVDPVEDPEIYSLILDSGLATSPGSDFQAAMRKIYPSLSTEWANARISTEQIERIQRQAARSDLIICSTFARLSSGRDISAIPRDQQTIINNLMDTGKPMIWIAFGNPYVLEHFPKIETYVCTFSDSDVSQRAAARAISGEITLSGTMPVSVPGYASVGDGLQIPKLEMVLKPLSNSVDLSSSDTLNNVMEVVDSYIKSDILSSAHIAVGLKGSMAVDTDFHQSPEIPAPSIDPQLSGLIREMIHPTDGIRTIYLAMLTFESGSLLLDAPVHDYLPAFRDTEVGSETVSDLLADISQTHQTTGGIISNSRLINEIVLRASGSYDMLLSGLPEEMIPFERLFSLSPGQHTGPGTQSIVSLSIKNIPVFLQTLLNRGIYNHKRIFKPSTIARFTNPGKNAIALGWMKPDKENWTGRIFSPDSFGYMDSGGLFLWVDPKEELFIFLYANTSIPSKQSTPIIDTVYEKIASSVMGSIKAM